MAALEEELRERLEWSAHSLEELAGRHSWTHGSGSVAALGAALQSARARTAWLSSEQLDAVDEPRLQAAMARLHADLAEAELSQAGAASCAVLRAHAEAQQRHAAALLSASEGCAERLAVREERLKGVSATTPGSPRRSSAISEEAAALRRDVRYLRRTLQEKRRDAAGEVAEKAAVRRQLRAAQSAAKAVRARCGPSGQPPGADAVREASREAAELRAVAQELRAELLLVAEEHSANSAQLRALTARAHAARQGLADIEDTQSAREAEADVASPRNAVAALRRTAAALEGERATLLSCAAASEAGAADCDASHLQQQLIADGALRRAEALERACADRGARAARAAADCARLVGEADREEEQAAGLLHGAEELDGALRGEAAALHRLRRAVAEQLADTAACRATEEAAARSCAELRPAMEAAAAAAAEARDARANAERALSDAAARAAELRESTARAAGRRAELEARCAERSECISALDSRVGQLAQAGSGLSERVAAVAAARADCDALRRQAEELLGNETRAARELRRAERACSEAADAADAARCREEAAEGSAACSEQRLQRAVALCAAVCKGAAVVQRPATPLAQLAALLHPRRSEAGAAAATR
eukprot:TRINITY_DN32731_c0_g1_i1.p2 TRINITY_DN32731_c0_g1~~TRINITY_DN32731_c0_g1_i1.p2  ORF type:complete len:627 (+),score=212.90 TRINITY_DN32731_c0_g1_i1:62-1882(+)